MRLIDGDIAKYAIEKRIDEATNEDFINGLLEAMLEIDYCPTVDPVKHGRWIDKYGDGDWHCSCCGAIVENHEQDYRNWYFCYHCGARMDGDKNG